MFYHQTEFDFSKEAKDWILEQYVKRFSQEFYHDLDVYRWPNSLASKELKSFLEQYKCNTYYYGISAFVSNNNNFFIGNPHIDTKFDRLGNSSQIKTRFNILVQGDPQDEMFWWQDWQYGDSRLVDNTFKSLNGISYTSKSVPGDTVESRWQLLGIPTKIKSNLLTPSAFVRTDCAHTVSVSPGPRLIVTVAIDKALEEIIGP
jgi:hypothetical protein